MDFRAMQRAVHENAKLKGFYNVEPSPAERIALVHSELSELLEAYRKDLHHQPSDHPGLELTQEEEEMADVVIRMLDFAEHRGVDLVKAIERKHSYNTGRPHMHGGKKF